MEPGADGNVLGAGPVKPAPAGQPRTDKKEPALPEQPAHEANPAEPAEGNEAPGLSGQPYTGEGPAVPAPGAGAASGETGRIPAIENPEHPAAGGDNVSGRHQDPIAEDRAGGEGE